MSRLHLSVDIIMASSGAPESGPGLHLDTPGHTSLGVQHSTGALWRADFAPRVGSSLRSIGAMQRGLASLQAAKNVALAVRMYDVCVRTVQTYGAAVWATQYHQCSPQHVVNNAMEASHLQFLRRWCRLRKNVPFWAIFAELGRLPLHYFWWREVIRFWNSVVARSEDDLWRDMLCENVAGPAWAGQPASRWAGQIHAFLLDVQYSTGPLAIQRIDEQRALACLCTRYSSVWDGLGPFPRVAPSERISLATYFCWFYRGDWLDRPGYLFLRLSHKHTYLMIRFKLGCHPLGIVTGRFHRVRRLQRVCSRCDTGALDDERHMVFECPSFEHLRSQYRQLFGQEVAFDMRLFFAHKDQHAVVRFVLACLETLEVSG